MELANTLAVFWLLCSALGVYVSVQKGRAPFEGAILGLLYGPLGCIIAGLLPTIEPVVFRETAPATPAAPAAPRHIPASPWGLMEDDELDDSGEAAATIFLADAEKQAGGVKPIEPVPLDAIAWAAQAEERERRNGSGGSESGA